MATLLVVLAEGVVSKPRSGKREVRFWAGISASPKAIVETD
jgi:hypothetical protein